MLNKSLVLVTSLFAFICLTGLSGCSTTSAPSGNYTSKYKGYTQVSNLPADYPTRYLPNGSIWNDFRRQMQLPLNLNKAQVQAQIRWYKAHQDFLNRSLTRGAQYFYYIVQETKRRNLPAELALIPIFESGYVPIGRSNKGAVGLWQFMPRSAANFKIRMNRWYDGRRDVIDSTDAALRYLTYLYYYFDKDWFLAISAYNCGEGNIQASVLRNKRHGYSADFWSLRLSNETRAYIPQLLAISAIIRNPERYGVPLVAINNGPYFDRIDVGQSMNLDKAAKMSGASDWTMRMLNAGLLHGVTEPDGPYVIAMPHSKMADFKYALSGKPKLLAANTTIVPVSPPAAVISSTKSSQTLQQQNIAARVATASAIAATAPDTKAHMAALANAAADEHKSVTSLAANEASQANDTDDEEDDNSSTSRQVKVANKKLTKKPAVVYAKPNSATKQYVVGRNETLFSIARQYNVDVNVLKRANNLKNNNIKPGQILQIPLRQESYASVDRAPETVVTANASNNSNARSASTNQKNVKTTNKVKSRSANPASNAAVAMPPKKTVKAASSKSSSKASSSSSSAPKKQAKGSVSTTKKKRNNQP